MRRLSKVLTRRILSQFFISDSGKFKIHYDRTGRNAVDSADDNNNGVPDYIEATASTLDAMWELQIDELGYMSPPSDGTLGGGPEIDIYVVDLSGSGVYGFAFPDEIGSVTTSYLEIDNNYTDSIYRVSRGLDALHVTLAHEFFHTIHYGYYWGRDAVWWYEASGTWMEEIAFPEVDDYLQYLPSVLSAPHRSIDQVAFSNSDTFVYGISLFAHFLYNFYGRDILLQLWTEIGNSQSTQLPVFDRIIRRHPRGGNGLKDAIDEFSTWNYFTGSRFQAGYYPEGLKYPDLRVQSLSVPEDTVNTVSGRVDHLGSAYFEFVPDLRAGGIRLSVVSPRGEWTHKIIRITETDTDIHRATNRETEISDWNLSSKIVLVITSSEFRGLGFGYSLTVEYNSRLSSVDRPTVFELGQNYPNPFAITPLEATTIPFSLDQPSEETLLSVFSISGDVVYSMDLGPKAPGRYTVMWDGRNSDGMLVSSGTYYYVLKTDTDTGVNKLSAILME